MIHRNRVCRRSSLRLLFSVVLTVVFLSVSLVAGCGDTGSSTIWGIDREEFLSRVRSGDTGFLTGLDYSTLKLNEVFRAGEGAALYLSAVFASLSMDEQEKELLRLEWDKGKGVFRQEAGERLVGLYFRQAEYEAAERLLGVLVRQDPDNQDIRRRLIEARYWQQKDGEVLKNLAEFRKKKIGFASDGYREEELLLWEAVSGCREGVPGWENRFRSLFLEYPASGIHSRAWEFIGLADSRRNRFHADELAAFAGKARTWTQEYGNAAAQFEKVLVPDSSIIRSAWMLREAGRSFQGAGRSLDGAGRIAALVPLLKGDALFAAEETAGRLYRAAEKYELADRYLEQSLVHAPDERSFDRVLWYRLSVQIRRSPDEVAGNIAEYASEWHSPEYFTDLLDELCRSFVTRSRWDLIWKVYSLIEATGPAGAVSQYAVLLASVIRAGRFSLPGVPDGEAVERLYRKALSGGTLYYRFLAAAALGESLTLETAAADPDTGEDSAVRKLVEGFFGFGLYRDGYVTVERNMDRFGHEEILSYAKTLFEAGKYTESLRLMVKIHDAESPPLTREVLSSLFPKAYGRFIEPLSAGEKYPASFLFGLVREESFFNPTVVSGAEAVGLSQLVPATAKDIGSRIGIKNPVLTDPETNLRIGSRYLGLLLERFRYPLYALAGYNAGYGRIRTWTEQWGGLPFEVFAERIPYEETRMYIHKVITSTVFYAWLYEGRGVGETVLYFFPWISLH